MKNNASEKCDRILNELKHESSILDLYVWLVLGGLGEYFPSNFNFKYIRDFLEKSIHEWRRNMNNKDNNTNMNYYTGIMRNEIDKFRYINAHESIKPVNAIMWSMQVVSNRYGDYNKEQHIKVIVNAIKELSRYLSDNILYGYNIKEVKADVAEIIKPKEIIHYSPSLEYQEEERRRNSDYNNSQRIFNESSEKAHYSAGVRRSQENLESFRSTGSHWANV